MKNLRKLGIALMVWFTLTNVNAQQCSSSIKADNYEFFNVDNYNNFIVRNPCENYPQVKLKVYSSIKKPKVTLSNNSGVVFEPIISPTDSLIGYLFKPVVGFPFNNPFYFQDILTIEDLDNTSSKCSILFSVGNPGCNAVSNIRTHSQICPEKNGKISFEVGQLGKLELLKNNEVVFSKEYRDITNRFDTISGLTNQVYQLRFTTLNSGFPLIYGYYNSNYDGLHFNLLVGINRPSMIELTGKNAICVGSSTNLTTSYSDVGGVWTSSSTLKATITNGVLKGIAPGSTTISYSIWKDECKLTGSKQITVEAMPTATISGPSKICWNGKAMFRASVAGGVWEPVNNALILSSSQGLFRNGTKPAVDNFKSGVAYTLTSKSGACVNKVVKNVYVRNVVSPSVTVSAPKTSIKLNEIVMATAVSTNPAVGGWVSTNTIVSTSINPNTKTAQVKGLRVGSGANVVYFADDATTGCRFSSWLGFNVLAAQSLVTATTDATSTIGVNVYPNPSNGNITLENISGANTISLVDMTGRTLKSVPVNAERMTVNFAGVQAGKYLVQITGEQMNETRTIVFE